MNVEQIGEIGRAILYEGYALYPYRASAVKNRQRFNFGVVYPPAHATAQVGADSAHLDCECLVRGKELEVQAHFLQLIAKETLDEAGIVISTWQEAIERQIDLHGLVDEPQRCTFSFPAGVEAESARIVRRRAALEGLVELSSHDVGNGWFRIHLSISNTTSFQGEVRDEVLLHSFVSAHAILHAPDGEFASLLEPPEELKQAAQDCRHQGLYPVLVGEAGSTATMLCSPIILYDYPAIAPESAGPLCDGTEIDEILSLRVLTLTDQEKSEMRTVDAFTRRILERTESLTPEDFMRMHGALRGAQ